MNSTKQMYDKLNLSKRGYKVLSFPEDIDTRGSKNVILLNINAVDGSRHQGSRYKLINPSVPSDTPAYQQSSSSSLSKKLNSVTRRIDTTIALYIPNNIQTSYGSEWNTTDLGAVGAVMDAATGLGDLSSVQGWKQLWEAGKQAVPDALLNTAAGATQTLTGLNVADAKSVATKSITNPYTEVMFNGVNNRTFSFTFKFIPKSKSEQDQVKRIIDELKFHRAPEMKYSKINNYMLFPSEFDITFVHRGVENPYLFKVSTCAMTNMSVNYGGDSHFATHSDGSPFFTELTIEFVELEKLTKARHESGY